MNKFSLALFIALVFPSFALAELETQTPEKLNAWWETNASAETWAGAYLQLMSELDEAYQKNGVKSFTDDPKFTTWLSTLGWLKLGIGNTAIIDNAELTKAFIELGKLPEVSGLLFQNLRPTDDAAKACAILVKIYQAHPEKVKDYAALAVAYAVVFDQPYPDDWPHHQVERKAVPFGDEDPVARFDFYVQSNETKKLETDLKTLTVTELKFLVDSFVNLDELRYAQKTKFKQSQFEKAYFSITYDYDRYKVSAWDWTYDTYTLEEIETKNGICVDQAYYASIAGKGLGIPTLYFSGQGTDGGHAWFGYMDRPGKWEMDCGRYSQSNFAVGFALDPQTWQDINDAELEFKFKSTDNVPNYAASQTAFLWALQQKDFSLGAKILSEARTLNPENPEIWKYEKAYLIDLKTPPETMKPFYESWIVQFARNTDMKVEGQTSLVQILKALNDPTAEDLQKSIVSQNRKKRSDLGVTAGADALLSLVEAKNWTEAELQYKKIIRQFDDQAGGNLFYDVVRPYVRACMKYDQKELAKDALKYAEKKIPMENGGLLEREFKSLEIAVNRKQK